VQLPLSSTRFETDLMRNEEVFYIRWIACLFHAIVSLLADSLLQAEGFLICT